MRTYVGDDNYGNPKSEFIQMLTTLSDDEFEKKTKDKIWLSAYANNNPRSDYHWQADACYDEAERRGKPQLYKRAWCAASGNTYEEDYDGDGTEG
jgi:hypothetical protein